METQDGPILVAVAVGAAARDWVAGEVCSYEVGEVVQAEEIPDHPKVARD